MDPLLSLIMSNMAQIKPNYFIYDPFVGTGSLLVGAAHCGARVSGADLDFNLMHARGLSSRMGQKYRSKSETILANLKQYNLHDKYIDVLIADFSTRYMRDSFKFDAIITDPPYGIREKAKKIGYKKKNANQQENENEDEEEIIENLLRRNCVIQKEEVFMDKNSNHIGGDVKRIPLHTKYMLGDIFHDLLSFASIHLNVCGRLVFWMPVYLEIDRTLITYVMFIFIFFF